MMKSDFFKLLLHQILQSMSKMANKKKIKSEKSSSNTSWFRSSRNFLENEIFKGIIGLILIFVAGFMIYAVISFFSTSAAD